MPEPAYETRPLREDERDWLSEVLLERRGRALIVGRGRVRQVKDQLWNASAQGNNAADRQPVSRQRGPVRGTRRQLLPRGADCESRHANKIGFTPDGVSSL